MRLIPKNKIKLLTPDDENWEEFTNRLTIHLNIRENPEVKDCYISDCDGSFKITRNILENRFREMYDVEWTIMHLITMGYYCDCDVFDGCKDNWGRKKDEASQ